MKVISWNINGLNNILSKKNDGSKAAGQVTDNVLNELINKEEPDIICLQEVRNMNANKLLSQNFQDKYPFIYTNEPTAKKGYSGTAILSKHTPIHVYYNMQGVHDKEGDEDLNDEGRIIRLVFDEFTLINIYTPNSKPKLERLEYRTKRWEPCFRDVVEFHKNGEKGKQVIICGDLNVAHKPIDLSRPRENNHSAGYTDEERLSLDLLLHNLQIVDTYRLCHPGEEKYTWWSQITKARVRNIGWRIDYFLITKGLIPFLVDSDILTNILGSDHAPVILYIGGAN